MRARYGQSLVELDPKAEARLRWKLDLYLLPSVALLYLFCFIDRANIGMLLLLQCHNYGYFNLLTLIKEMHVLQGSRKTWA